MPLIGSIVVIKKNRQKFEDSEKEGEIFEWKILLL